MSGPANTLALTPALAHSYELKQVLKLLQATKEMINKGKGEQK